MHCMFFVIVYYHILKISLVIVSYFHDKIQIKTVLSKFVLCYVLKNKDSNQ